MRESIEGYRLDDRLEDDEVMRRFRAFARDERGFETEARVHVLALGGRWNAAARAALEEDVEVVRALHSSHLDVPVETGTTQAGRPYLVTAASHALPLAALVKKAPLPPPLLVRVLADVALGLQDLHGAGVVHGAIRPNAVWVDERGFGRLTDLGVGRAASMLASEGSVVLEAVARFRSPEEVDGATPSFESDRFALASLFYELLSGEAAFDAPNALAVALKISMAQRPSMDGLTALSGGARALLGRMFAREPGDRPNAGEIGKGFSQAASAEPDVRRQLAERVVPVATDDDDGGEGDHVPFEFGTAEPTSLETATPRHLFEAAPSRGSSAPLDLQQTVVSETPLGATSEEVSTEEVPLPPPPDDITEDAPTDALPSPRARAGSATLVLEAPGERPDGDGRWLDRTVDLGPSHDLAPPPHDRAPPPPPDPFAPPAASTRADQDERDGPHPAVLWTGVIAGAVFVMGLAAILTILLTD